MNIIAIIIYIFGVLFAILWGILMRHKAKTEQATEKIFEVFGLLMVVSLILVLILSLSPFHLLWMFPASFFLGFISLLFPLNFLLWPLASLYGSLWYIGVKPLETNQEQSEVTLLKDRAWGLVDGELCLISDFSPMMESAVKDGEVISPERNLPYASVTLECKKRKGKIKGFITHKIDFANLWAAFRERGINEGKEEVLIYWSAKHYKYKWYQAISNFFLSVSGSTPFPKLVVMVCPKGKYGTQESWTDRLGLSPKDEIMVYVYGLLSIKWWKPEVIE